MWVLSRPLVLYAAPPCMDTVILQELLLRAAEIVSLEIHRLIPAPALPSVEPRPRARTLSI